LAEILALRRFAEPKTAKTWLFFRCFPLFSVQIGRRSSRIGAYQMIAVARHSLRVWLEMNPGIS
jgi:hypothetical protein